MNKSKLQQLVRECVKETIVYENLQLDNKLKQEVTNFVNALVSGGSLSTYHRSLTAGDMNANDFKEELVHKIISSIRKWVEVINDKSNWENGSMIK